MDKEEKPMEGVTITMYGASSSTKTDATSTLSDTVQNFV